MEWEWGRADNTVRGGITNINDLFKKKSQMEPYYFRNSLKVYIRAYIEGLKCKRKKVPLPDAKG